MTPERAQLVRDTVVLVEARADEAAACFYARLFTLDPETRTLFDGVDMAVQGAKFVAMLASIVRALDEAPAFVSQVASLGRRHAHLHVTAAHYESVGAALCHTVQRTLGPHWSPEVGAAWQEAFALVAAVMQRASGAHTLPASETGRKIPI